MIEQICEGCGKSFYNIFDNRPVCMDCVGARARVAFSGSCKCGNKKRPGAVLGGAVVMRVGGREIRGRSWIPCLRCLGTIKQVS